MSVPPTTITFYKLRRFDSPQILLGAGFAAGMLVFALWLWHLPRHDQLAVHARGNGEIAASVAPGAGGVLSGITGQPGRGNNFGTADNGEDSAFFTDEQAVEDPDVAADANVGDAYAAGDSDVQGDNMAVGESVGAPPAQEGAALTDSLLDSPPPPEADAAAAAAPPPAGAPLQTYYVEIEVAPGDVQVLQLQAESPDHARAMLRDFRGDPRILRGPTTEPLQ